MSRRAARVSDETRGLVFARAGYRCERCGNSLHGTHGVSVHHRTPRGMGGSRDATLALAGNLLALCGSGTTGCHGEVESDREAGYANGWLVRRPHVPAETPVLLFGFGWAIIDNEGMRYPTTPDV